MQALPFWWNPFTNVMCNRKKKMFKFLSLQVTHSEDYLLLRNYRSTQLVKWGVSHKGIRTDNSLILDTCKLDLKRQTNQNTSLKTGSLLKWSQNHWTSYCIFFEESKSYNCWSLFLQVIKDEKMALSGFSFTILCPWCIDFDQKVKIFHFLSH